MATFGSFETEREIYSDAIYTVYAATKPGDAKSEYAVKLFHTQRGFEAEIPTELGGLLNPQDVERSCIESIGVQERGAAASAFIAPVLESGHDERGVWYATKFYHWSVNKIISGRVALTQDALTHIIRSIIQGALDLQRTCGRSPGDIQLANVQITKSETLS